MVIEILEQQQQNMLMSPEGRSRDRAAAYSSNGVEEKGKYCRSWMSKSSCSKGEKCSFEHDTAKKGKGKGNLDQEASLKRVDSAERQYARKTGKSLSGKEDRPPCFNYRRENCSHDRECDYLHLPHCKYFQKKHWKLERIVHSYIHQIRSTSPKRRR